jgi:zinc protease
VAVGDITPVALGTLLDEVFGGLPAEATLAHVRHVDPLPAGRQAVIEMDVPQSVVVFGLEGIERHDPDYMAAAVLNHIVGGGGFSSRLMEEVRVKRGLAYSVSTSLSSSRYASVMRGGVATRNDLVGQSIDVIRLELRKIAEGEIDARDLDNAKAHIVGSYPLRFDANGKIASQLLGTRRNGFGPEYVGNRSALVNAVTLDDLKRVARRLFNPDNLIVSVVGKPSLSAARDGGAGREVSAA